MRKRRRQCSETRLSRRVTAILRHAVAQLLQTLFGMSAGGQNEPVGEGISEMRIDYGPGYRVYIKQRGEEFVVLLCGGDKSTQDTDIAFAKKLARELED